ncbi:MAG: sigma-70 family RNA polymerase sigma factor [Tannerella sp.]|jgi:RNA polymerase sigma-70 factor (ECF subfamily)|nr:sigma-70 family RNA polymerase sigma factor [Tannerella sp.]
MNETQLIAGCLNGDRKAQRTLYDTYSRKMLGICMRYVNDREVARDLLQDGFVKVFNSLASFAGTGSLEAWMRTIFVNEALGYLRRTNVLHRYEDISTADGVQDDSESAISKMAVKELMDIIGKLPVGFRTVFNMYTVEGYSHREIAEALDITESTSRSQYVRARRWLQEQIKNAGYYTDY